MAKKLNIPYSLKYFQNKKKRFSCELCVNSLTKQLIVSFKYFFPMKLHMLNTICKNMKIQTLPITI